MPRASVESATAPRRALRLAPLRPIFEAMEDRTMLNADIVVGRVPSSWTAGGVVGNRVSVTYTVYNGGAEEITGATLSTNLPAGVAFESASVAPAHIGQSLSWQFGTIAPYARASVEVGVALASAGTLGLDLGASASATIAGATVSDASPPLSLRAGTIAGQLLASTVDANATDAFIQEKAAELDYDPSRVIAFLANEVGFESYVGSLRGSRGTLWGLAGNAVDEASLGVALMRASGVPSRYASGTLSDANASQLIATMFPDPSRIVGCIGPGIAVADPIHDPALIAETRSHSWIEYDVGSGFVAADTALGTGAPGQTFAATSGAFAEVADALRHKVTVRLDRELTSTGLFGAVQGVKTVLEETFATADLVGKPLSVIHHVDHSAAGFIFTATTNTYSPFLRVGDDAFPTSPDAQISGESYQEVLTNFPFGTQALTGVFLEVDLTGPDGPKETYFREVLDRIGFAVRKNGGTPNLGLSPDGAPALTDGDVTTISVSSGVYDSAAVDRYRSSFDAIRGRVERLPNGGGPSEEGATQIASITVDSATAMTRLYAAGFMRMSDESTAQLAANSMIKAYFARPRLVISSDKVLISQDLQSALTSYSLDLRRDAIRALAFPGQNLLAPKGFNLARGTAESAIERDVFVTLSPDPMAREMAFSATSVFEAAEAQGVGTVEINDGSLLDAFAYPAEAKARMNDAIGRGWIVVAPERPVEVHGEETVAWFEIDPVTGETIGVTENGAHGGGPAEWSALFLAFVGQAVTTILYWAVVPSVFICTIGGATGTIDCMKELDKYMKALPNTLGGALKKAYLASVKSLNGLINRVGTVTTPINADLGNNIKKITIRIDPPVGDLLYSPPPSPEFANLGTTGPGLPLDIAPDPILSVPIGGAELPLVFKVGVRNTGPNRAWFTLSPSSIPAGFKVETSVPRVSIPAGEVGEVGICLVPEVGVPAFGTPITFGLTVAAENDPTIQGFVSETFIMPEVRAVTMSATPASLSAIPGAAVTMTLRLVNAGNVAVTVVPGVQTTAGLTVQGFAAVAIAPGQTVEQTVTLTPDAFTPLNTSLTGRLTANFGTAGAPLSQFIRVPLRVEAPGATSIRNAAEAARELGRTDLAARLGDLSLALTTLVVSPGDLVPRGQSLAAIDAVTTLLEADPAFAAAAAALDGPRAALAAATTPAEVQAAVTQVGAALDGLSATLTALSTYRFEASFQNNAVVGQVGAGSEFTLFLRNLGSVATTYDFALEGVPADVDAVLSLASITLLSGAFTPSSGVGTVTVTVTPESSSRLDPFEFTLIVTPREAPTARHEVLASLTPRSEFVSVVGVSTDLPYVQPGGTVQVSARLLNVVNEARNALATFEVRDGSGATLFTSPAAPANLGVLTAITTVEIGGFDTTGLARGDYVLFVRLTEADETPIPGATGEGRLFVGSPVTAQATIEPDRLATGAATVTTTLTLDARSPIVGNLEVLAQRDLTGDNGGTVKNGNLLYASDSSGIKVYTLSDPSDPQLLATFGERANQLKVHGGRLYALQANGNTGAARLFIYGLADPAAPTLLGTTPGIPYSNVHDMIVTDTHVFFTIVSITFWLGSNDIFGQTGDLIAVDVTNPAAPVLAGVLLNTNGANNDGVTNLGGIDQSGGNFNMWGLAALDANTLLVASTTATGTDTQTGVGRVLVIDISDPSHMAIVRELQIPGTRQVLGLNVDGKRAYLTASTGGWNDFNQDLGFTGNVALATIDVSDPRNPALVDAAPIDRASRGLQYARYVGSGRFVFNSQGSAADAPRLYLADLSDPANPALSSVDLPSNINTLSAEGDLAFAVSADGLIVYNIGEGQSIASTASVRVPNGQGTAIVPGSFGLAPTRVVAGGGFDTLEWDFAFTPIDKNVTITWETALTGLRAGESRPVVLDGEVSFVALGAAGKVGIAPLVAAVDQVLGLDPPTRAARPGESATFDLVVRNPTATEVTYAMALQGLPAAWSNLPLEVTVGPEGQTSVALTLTSEGLAALGAYGFVVTATAPGGASGSAHGSVELRGEPIFPNADSRGIVVGLSPLALEVGPGQRALYTVRVTNVGSATGTFDLALTLPPGLSGVFSEQTVTLSPGAGNYRDLTLSLTTADGQSPGGYGFGVTATSTTHPDISGSVAGVLNVSTRGVRVSLSPTPGGPARSYRMTVTNTGLSVDTFDVSLSGPVALVSTLGLASVTLAPGASRVIDFSAGDLGFALPGQMLLVASAVSRIAPSVRDSASASASVAPRDGLSASLEPGHRMLAAPGLASFVLRVRNTGNQGDAYSAEVVGVRGPVGAKLVGPDGVPTPFIARFNLSALSGGALTLHAELGAFGSGEVDVLIRSLNNPSRTALVTARLASETLETTTRLTVSPSTAPAGAPVVLTAVVALPPGVTSTSGQVIFSIDGVDRRPVAVTVAGGEAFASITVVGLGSGTHQASARFSGDGALTGSASGTVPLTITSAPVTVPEPEPVPAPRLIGLVRHGIHNAPTTLVLTFDGPLNANRAVDASNYRITDAKGRTVRVAWASYDDATRTVTLRPVGQLGLHQTYFLTLNGATPSGITAPGGQPLDGDGDGRPGGNAVRVVNQRSLATVSTNYPKATPTPRALFPASWTRRPAPGVVSHAPRIVTPSRHGTAVPRGPVRARPAAPALFGLRFKKWR